MKREIVGGVVFGALFVSGVSFAQELGGPGESCRARSDCKTGLKCINQSCQDENAPQGGGGGGGGGGDEWSNAGQKPKKKSSSEGGSNAALDDWLGMKLQGVHPFVGLTWGGGFMTPGVTASGAMLGGGNFNNFNGNFLFALNGGVFINNHQLQLEIAPVTYFFYLGRGSLGPAFSVTASYAYFIPLYDSEIVKVFWPLRFGVGMLAAPDRNLGGNAYFQPRADFIGPAIQIGHVMIDMFLPSFRYAVTSQRIGPVDAQGHILSWIFGANVSYVF